MPLTEGHKEQWQGRRGDGKAEGRSGREGGRVDREAEESKGQRRRKGERGQGDGGAEETDETPEEEALPGVVRQASPSRCALMLGIINWC